jgi:hypothetical protein
VFSCVGRAAGALVFRFLLPITPSLAAGHGGLWLVTETALVPPPAAGVTACYATGAATGACSGAGCSTIV